MRELPDVLVCGVGGTLGEAWMRGLLDGLAAGGGPDLRQCEHFVGSSAGSIVAAVLAAGERPDAGARAAAAWGEAAEEASPEPLPDAGLARSAVLAAGRAGAALAAPFAGLALAAATPGGAFVRAAALRAVPRGQQELDRLGRLIDRLGPRFDGRLRIAAVDRARGRRVLFGAPGAPTARVRDAVLASCAVPGVFAPVTIDGREYVDGGVWSPTNLDAAPGGRGTRVLCLAPTASSRALRAATLAAVHAETLVLRGRGASVELITPDARSATTMGGRLMDARHRDAVLAAGYAQGRRAA